MRPSERRRDSYPGIFFAAFSFLLLLSVSGCASKTADTRPAKELYEAGIKDYLVEKYDDSESAFKTLLENFPLSQYAVDVELLIGDVAYAAEKYDEAASYYTNFVAMHPTHQRAPYALFQKGMSYFRDVLALDRDQTTTRKSLMAFEDLIADYPGSVYLPMSLELRGFLRRRLADREFYVARFYFKGKNYKAALQRLRGVIQDYFDTGLTEETLFYIGESYMKLGEDKLAAEAYSTLIKGFPEGVFAKEAGSRLKGI